MRPACRPGTLALVCAQHQSDFREGARASRMCTLQPLMCRAACACRRVYLLPCSAPTRRTSLGHAHAVLAWAGPLALLVRLYGSELVFT